MGGGNWPRPGEISLAHRGVLFLDELPEFGMRVLEVLRQPLEDKVVTISRARGSLTFPANFMLVGGHESLPVRLLRRPDHENAPARSGTVTRYQKRISGPLLDRIDIHVEVPRVDYDKLTYDRLGEPSEDIRRRVEAARLRQRVRLEGTRLNCNADMGPADVRRFCPIDAAEQSHHPPGDDTAAAVRPRLPPCTQTRAIHRRSGRS